jgi:hypothetical protein
MDFKEIEVRNDCAGKGQQQFNWLTDTVRGLLGFSHCELLLLDAGSRRRGQFRNPEEGECPPLEATTKQQLVKTVTDWEDFVCPIVICEVCRTVTA